MTSTNLTTNKFFLDKKFYLHLTCSSKSQICKSAELIKTFGGQIEQFLDGLVSYVLTDVPKNEWPPQGHDPILERAISCEVKLMSLFDLLMWCSKYMSSQSSSDEDDEVRANLRQLQPPFIKIEDEAGRFAPTFREFKQWPELPVHINLPVVISQQGQGQGQITAQVTGQNTGQVTGHNHGHGHVKRRHSVYCEICNLKIEDKIEEHVQTPNHLLNTEKLNWNDVNAVIDSLPKLSSLNMRRLTNLTPPNGIDHQEFFCLHKVDSISQLFFNH